MAESFDDNQADMVEKAVQQFVDAQLQGREPDIDEFVKKYPGLDRQIRANIRDLQKIDGLFDTIVQARTSDFDETIVGDDLIGHKVGSFEIRKVIGRGGMGVVYLAGDTKLDRPVALKSMPPELQADPTARMRFWREAKLLASLNHPNIAIIHDIVEQDDGAGYLILEYIEGETLADYIARKPLGLEQALSIGRQIAEAVAAAHDKGVIHRDLKPGNIKLTADRNAKVLDFGLAKATGRANARVDATVTQPGRMVGTPAYMSPEQARGIPTDRRTDIWSFGCVMYEMLTGHPAFEGETVTDVIARILEREPDWAMLPESTPSNIKVLLRRCLEKDPERRLEDIADAAREISAAASSPATAQVATIPSMSRKIAALVCATVIIVLSAIAVRFALQRQARPAPRQTRLVVLPFENLGSIQDEYFVDGITDAVTGRLTGIHGLGVIARQSAMQYKKRDKGIRQIATELHVDYILEGTVQCERPSDPNSPVRIRPQLIRVSDDTNVWAETYDGEMRDVFRVQSDVAEQVAQALDVTILEPEARPTGNAEAYDYYLRGNDYFNRSYLESDVSISIRMYEKAIELDPTFALAYAQLSRAHDMMYWHSYDRSEERIGMARRAVEKGLQLNSSLPEVHLALGHYYYHCHLDYDRALEQFAIVRKSQPNNAELLGLTGYVQRRQGKFEEAVANLKKASELNPLSSGPDIGETLVLMRRYAEAERYYQRAISLSPDVPTVYSWKAWLYLLWEGNTEKARTDLEMAMQNIGPLKHHAIVHRSVLLDVFDGNYQDALTQLSSWPLDSFDTHFYSAPKAQLCAQINGLMGDRQLEQAHYESARDILEARIQEQPEDARLRSSLGIAFAGLNRKNDAIREGKLATELLPVTRDAWRGCYRVKDLARIYVMVGEFDRAIEQLKFLLERPSEMSIPLIQLDPVWDPLRDHPRFKKLVEAGK